MNSRWLNWMIEAPPLADVLLKMTALLAVAWAAHFALRRANPRWRMLLWRGVAVGLVLMPILRATLPSWKVGVGPCPPTATTRILAENNIAQLPPPASSLAVHTHEATVYGEPEKHTAVAPTAAVRRSSFSLLAWARAQAVWLGVGGWILIASALTVRLCVGWRRIRRMVKSTTAAPGGACSFCAGIAHALGIARSVELRLNDEIPSPFLTGLRRPLLILPRRMAEPEYFRELRGIFAHELSHLRSNDLFWVYVLHWLSVAVWFHPLVWRIRAAHSSACEEVSDAVTADFLGDAKAYSRTLARVALDLACRPPAIGGVPMARLSEISRRLNALKRRGFSPTLTRTRVGASFLSAVLAMALLSSFRLAYTQVGENQTEVSDNEPKISGVPALPRPAEGSELTVSESSRSAGEDKDRHRAPDIYVKLDDGFVIRVEPDLLISVVPSEVQPVITAESVRIYAQNVVYEGQVQMKYGGLLITGDSMTYRKEDATVQAQGNVGLVLPDEKEARPLLEADSVTVTGSRIVYEGNARMKYGDLFLRADKIAYREKDKALQAEGKVTLENINRPSSMSLVKVTFGGWLALGHEADYDAVTGRLHLRADKTTGKKVLLRHEEQRLQMETVEAVFELTDKQVKFAGGVKAVDFSPDMESFMHLAEERYSGVEVKGRVPLSKRGRIVCSGPAKVVQDHKLAICYRLEYDTSTSSAHLFGDEISGKKVLFRDEEHRWQAEAEAVIFAPKNNEVRFLGQVKTIPFSPDKDTFFRLDELEGKKNERGDALMEKSRSEMLVVPLVGIGGVRFGMSEQEVVKILGEAGERKRQSLAYPSRGFSIAVAPRIGVYQFSCYTKKVVPWWDRFSTTDFQGATKEGIGMGSSEQQIIEAFGQPDERKDQGRQVDLNYEALGLHFILLSDKVVQFSMMKPQR